MEITLTIPDEIVADLQNGGSAPLSRQLLEMAALEGYRSGLLTSYQVQKMLGFDDRFEVDAFLKKHGVFLEYTIEDLDRDTAALAAILNKK